MHDPKPLMPKLDGGPRAWLFLAAAIIVEGILYGTCYLVMGFVRWRWFLTSGHIGFQASYGVFLRYYQTHSDFGDDPFLPAIGLLSIVRLIPLPS